MIPPQKRNFYKRTREAQVKDTIDKQDGMESGFLSLDLFAIFGHSC